MYSHDTYPRSYAINQNIRLLSEPTISGLIGKFFLKVRSKTNCLCSTIFLLTVNILCSSILEVIKIYIWS